MVFAGKLEGHLQDVRAIQVSGRSPSDQRPRPKPPLTVETSDAWLANMSENRTRVMSILESTYGKPQASLWWHRWRIFFMACAELFGYANGEVWPIGHYRFRQSEISLSP